MIGRAIVLPSWAFVLLLVIVGIAVVILFVGWRFREPSDLEGIAASFRPDRDLVGYVFLTCFEDDPATGQPIIRERSIATARLAGDHRMREAFAARIRSAAVRLERDWTDDRDGITIRDPGPNDPDGGRRGD